MLSPSNSRTAFKPDGSRFFLVRSGVVFLFFLLAGRLFYVQGVLRTELEGKADRQMAVRRDSQPVRQRIVDRHGAVLAETVNVSSCFVDPSLMVNRPAAARKIAKALRMNEAALASKLKKATGSFLWIKRGITPFEVAELEKQKIPGVAFRAEKRRHYPNGVIASHLLGLVGTEGAGLSGLELTFDSALRAPKANAAGKPQRYPAGELQLTIDASIQQIVERELEWGAKKTGSKKGMVVIQNPWTGEILAMAAWPPVSLDPDQPSKSVELRVPALMDVFEPGSTFKIVIAAAAWEEGVVTEKEIFDGEKGAWKVADITIHDHEPLKRMNFEDMIVHSSNIGTAKLADRIGAQRLYQYARLFGFGVFPGSGVSAEAKGVLRPLSKWSGVSKYVLSFGQELGVTAVQLIGSYSALANGGILMEPRIVQKITNDEKVVWQAPPLEVRRVVSAATAKKMNELLVKVVEKGTGVNASIQWDPSTKVAGKTGTAQKWDAARHRYHDLLALISFCGFFPADNPKLSMVVILDEPQGRSWGGLDAAPIFRRIAEQLSPKLITMNGGTTGESS